MGLVNGAKDGAIVGIGVVILWYLIKQPPLTIFGQQDYYPEGVNPKKFDPDKPVTMGSEGMEVQAVKGLLNKYCISYTSNGIECCPELPTSGSGGFYLDKVLLDQSDNYFDNRDETVLFNRTGTDAISYRTLVNAIKGKNPDGSQKYNQDGTKAPNNWNVFINDCE